MQPARRLRSALLHCTECSLGGIAAAAVPVMDVVAPQRCGRLPSPQPAPVDVALQAVPPMTVPAVAGHVAPEDVLSWYAGAAAELQASVVEPAGAPGGVYDDELLQTGHGHVVVHLSTPRPPRTGHSNR